MMNIVDRPILPWRIVAGAFLHFVVPVYLVALIMTCLLDAPTGATAEQVLRIALPFSGWFLAGYGLLALLSVLGARLIDPVLRSRRRRRQACDPQRAEMESRDRLARALAEGRSHFGKAADVSLDTIARQPWDHADPRFQSLSRDLAELVHSSATALSTARDERRGAIATIAATSLERIAAALADLVAHRAQDDETAARTAARYVEMRYGGSDFAGDDD